MPERARQTRQARRREVLSDVPDGWIASSEAATMLAVTAQTVRNRVAAGRLSGAMCRAAGGVGLYVDPSADPRLRLAVGLDDAGIVGAGVDVARLSARQREQAQRRYRAVTAWRAAREALPKGADVAAEFRTWAHTYSMEMGFKRPIGWTTMWRWSRALDAGDVAELAPRAGGPAPTEPDARAWAFFQSLYLTTGKRSVYDCWLQTGAEAQGRTWGWPSYAIIARKVRRDIPHAVSVYHRRGRKAHADHCLPYIERDYHLAPNEWWSVDHHQLDVACIGPQGRPAFPWITHWQDVKSRKCMGLLLHFCPNLNVVLATFRRAILDYGCPANIIMDNGREFMARQFAGGRRKRLRLDVDTGRVRFALAHLPTTAHFALPYNAAAKPNERTFGTLRQQLSTQWATYRGAGTDNRPEGLDAILRDYRANGLVPKAATLEAALRQWFDEVYGNRTHRGRGMRGRSPNDVYRTERREVTRVADAELCLLMMRTTEPLTVGRNGVRLFGRSYHSPELYPHLGQRVYARYDPAEIGRLYIHDLEDRLICVAERLDLLAWGASHDDVRQRMRVKAQHRKAAQQFAQTSELLAGDALHNLALQRRATQAAAQATPEPDPPDGGGEPATVRLFRTALADTAEQLARLPRAVGLNGAASGPAAQADEPTPREQMDEFLGTADAAGTAGDVDADAVFDDLDLSDPA